MTQTRQKGFTLIELLVVITIIGILAALILVSLTDARQRARDAQRRSAAADIALAMELHNDDLGDYPDATNTGAPTISAAELEANYNDLVGPLVTTGGYLNRLPEDPTFDGVAATDFWYAGCDDAGALTDTDPSDYELSITLETNDNVTDDGGSTGDGRYEVGTFLDCLVPADVV